ncbi:hypothetical protein J4G43_025860 [Bradyrhizobium barranii subsp. barranii]|uniref:Uncharacterized protein n=1 Tax=Bradyrhizobium barranii subsp. barranii TaxID=2823807 RepID=A0A939MC09_9BRAD|nr:hypothetical protein [Bradyrhizobium barranii]UEM08251.1 hypothetical protein J4G43_025860 [Bradyrhizobium barranii subsp. barranii]
MESNNVATIAVIISGVTLLIMVGEKLFGGGNRLAAMFAKLEKETTAAIQQLRTDLTGRVDEYEDNYRVGLDAMRANIHAMQIALLEFRAKMAEEYLPKGDHGEGVREIKSDMRQGFERLEQRLERIERSERGDRSDK